MPMTFYFFSWSGPSKKSGGLWGCWGSKVHLYKKKKKRVCIYQRDGGGGKRRKKKPSWEGPWWRSKRAAIETHRLFLCSPLSSKEEWISWTRETLKKKKMHRSGRKKKKKRQTRPVWRARATSVDLVIGRQKEKLFSSNQPVNPEALLSPYISLVFC